MAPVPVLKVSTAPPIGACSVTADARSAPRLTTVTSVYQGILTAMETAKLINTPKEGLGCPTISIKIPPSSKMGSPALKCVPPSQKIS
jgi:hypothetical protein